jgi:hypothetical protein
MTDLFRAFLKGVVYSRGRLLHLGKTGLEAKSMANPAKAVSRIT